MTKFNLSLLKIVLVVLAVIGGIFAFSHVTKADTTLNGWGWSSNIGWIKLSGPSYGVKLNSSGTSLSGYAWSPNIGWINFPGNLVALGTGEVYGTARAIGPNADGSSGWTGTLKLSGPNYQTKVNGSNSLTGWAWGDEVIGWVHFKGEDTPPCNPATDPNCHNGPSCPEGTTCYPGGGYCGDGIINGNEECDGNNLAGRMCTDFGFAGGTLRCNPPSGGIVSLGANNLAAANSALSNGGAGLTETLDGPDRSKDVFDSGLSGSVDTGSPITPGGSTGGSTSSGSSNLPCRFNTAQCTNSCTPGVDCPTNPPNLITLNGQDRIVLSNQSIGLPALATPINIRADGGTGSLNVKVLSIKSIATGNDLIVPGQVVPSSYAQPKCRIGVNPLTPQTLGELVPCKDAHLTMPANSNAVFNLQIQLPLAPVKTNSPYKVRLGDPAVPGEYVEFLFEYLVGNVTPV